MMGAVALLRRAPSRSNPAQAPPAARAVLTRFFLGSAAAIAVALVGGYFALRSVAIDQAKRDTRTKTQQSAQLVESALVDGLVTGNPAALASVDELVVARVLSSSVVRVKIWSASGHVLYSDNAAEIGGHYALDDQQLRLLRVGGAEVEVTNLARPENALDRGEGDLIESYTRIRTPSGTPLLFEIYERFDSVTASARRLLRALAPPILGAIALIVLVQAPLAWSLTRRLQRGYEEREALLANAIAASNRERRRIASYLHDGSVQEIAGVAFALAPLADAATARGATTEAQELRSAIEQLRHNVRDLRTLLLDLHPPHLAAAGLASSLADLVSPLHARGVKVSVAIDGAADSLDDSQEALIYRVAQEAVRNVLAYADARTVDVELTSAEGVVHLVVRDDGSGFSPELRERRKADGHLGLSLLEELVRQAGGRLDVRSGEGQGTTVELEVPPR
jgi:two-component system NarL family sensor kinase